ncbi:hypothetical protein [Microcoleus sp. FACHB-1515]|nr:hypothetical protein [Microcoleus sp. FACHB-1515]
MRQSQEAVVLAVSSVARVWAIVGRRSGIQSQVVIWEEVLF